jgi:ribosomal-protein-serine acetyltransferase
VPRFELSESAYLRQPEDGDVDELYALIDANRDYLAQWMPWAQGQTREGTLDFVRETKRKADANEGLELALIEDDEIVGMVGLHVAEPHNQGARVGYWLAEDRQGRGLVTRAVTVLVSHAFEELGFNRIEIRAAPGNAPSRAIPERLGFVEEGILRQAERVGEGYRDNVVYSMLARDWAARS